MSAQAAFAFSPRRSAVGLLVTCKALFAVKSGFVLVWSLNASLRRVRSCMKRGPLLFFVVRPILILLLSIRILLFK